MGSKSKFIITHNGTFHADEITAIALLKVFNPSISYIIRREGHQEPLPDDLDYAIDKGRKYDGKKFFDHHQWEGGKSSAGIMWEHIKETLAISYPEIDKLIKAVDDNDVGVKPAEPFEYSSLIRMFNHDDIHDKEQLNSFHRALNFVVYILDSMKTRQELVAITASNCKNAHLWPGTTDVLNLVEYQAGWADFVNGETRPGIEAVVWYDNKLGTYNIQTTTVSTSSYDKVGKILLPYDKMNFVHANSFFAVAKNKELMDYYIKNFRK